VAAASHDPVGERNVGAMFGGSSVDSSRKKADSNPNTVSYQSKCNEDSTYAA